jgi:hypothetical protein
MLSIRNQSPDFSRIKTTLCMGMRAVKSRQIIFICLVIALSVLVIDALDQRFEIRSKADARAKVDALISLMDQEKNGQASKAEFMKFMSEEFDRVDSDRSGSITPEQLLSSFIIQRQHPQPAGAGK